MITDKIDNITKIRPEYLRPDCPAPEAVKIELSPRCNYRCSFCALRSREKQPKHDMDFDLFKRITRDMKAAGVREIGCFFLGESFMNPKLLVNSIEYLKKDIEMEYVFLTSNASLCKPEYVQAEPGWTV
jgi:MoaA/NifB/PqqE/SkfB family radical SAM enzyme